MLRRHRAFLEFVRTLVKYGLPIRETLVVLLLLTLLGGCAIVKVEGIKLSDASHFACITGLSVVYGRIVPTTDLGRVVSVAIGLIGMLFIGLTVAIATRALRDTVAHYRKTDGRSAS